MEQRKRNREKRARRLRKKGTKSEPNLGPPDAGVGLDNGGRDLIQPNSDRDILTHAIRATGFLPMVLVVIFLSSHPWYLTGTPTWLEPLLQKQIAALTLTAGHAALVGLLLNNRGRFNWSTYAMLIASVATATAGHRSIGESTIGHTVTVTLFLTTIPAVWAERLSFLTRRTWNFLWSKKGLTIIGAATFVILVAFNQARDENYIRNWLIIPMGIFLGGFIAVQVCWVVLKLSFKYVPVLFRLLGSRASRIWQKINRLMHRG